MLGGLIEVLESAAASPLASVGGELFSAYSTHRENAMARDFAAYQADIQRGREDTAHQREVKDLVAAGLNPILSAGGGGSGAGSAPVVGAAPGARNPFGSAAQIKRMDEEIKNLVETNRNINMDTANKSRQFDVMTETINKLREETANLQKQGSLLDFAQSSAKAESDFWKDAGPTMKWLQNIINMFRGGAAGIGSLGR